MTGRLIVSLLLLLGTASAQLNIGSTAMVGHVRARVVFADRETCDPSTWIRLTASAGFTFAENPVDAKCVAEFFDVPAGDYRVSVSGADVAKYENVEFALSPGMTQDVEVRAMHKGDAGPVQGHAGPAFVSASDLGVPYGAEKEFEKANRLISKQDWAKATERLRKAIAIYPSYAAAYNNLGAVYYRSGDVGQAREALQKAVAFNDHMALAYVNLARVSSATKDFPAVEAFVGKAMSLAAPDADELKMLAYAQLADQHYDQAIETSRQAHRSQLGHHAFLHVVAAKAYELRGESDDSIAELQQYVNEEPAGPRAEKIRKTLAEFQAHTCVH